MNNDYHRLLAHIQHHKVREWLIAGAKKEDARTILAAVRKLSGGQLNRRMARMLSR
jgi:hypothetical protein